MSKLLASRSFLTSPSFVSASLRAWYLRPWLYAAAQSGWDSWAVNLRGHHGSRPVTDLGRVSVSEYVEDVEDCLRQFGEAVVIGHSMGGLIAQKVAEGGRVRAAVFATSAAPHGIRVVRWSLLMTLPQIQQCGVPARANNTRR